MIESILNGQLDNYYCPIIQVKSENYIIWKVGSFDGNYYSVDLILGTDLLTNFIFTFDGLSKTFTLQLKGAKM